MYFHDTDQLHRERERDLRNEQLRALADRRSALRRAAARRQRRADRISHRLAAARRIMPRSL